jgi:hypothetical protein
MATSINYEVCNPDSRDLLYVGKNQRLFDQITSRMPNLSARRIEDFGTLKGYLQDRMMLWSMAVRETGAGRATATDAIYPATFISEPEIPYDENAVDGVGFIEQTNENVIGREAFVVLPENSYGTTEQELEKRCSEKDVKFVRESELMVRPSEFVIRQQRSA